MDGRATDRRPGSGRRRGVCAALGLALAGVLAAAAAATAEPAVAATPCGQAGGLAGLTDFADGRRPGACWRPYGDRSPFNTPIGKRARKARGSDPIVRTLVRRGGGPAAHGAGDPTRDYGIATYFSRASDPLHTVTCLKPWGTCALEGARIRIPREAKPAGLWPLTGADKVYDSHLTVVDTVTGWEYDMWGVQSMAGGLVQVKWGGRTRIDGNGLGSDAVAARYGSLAGVIRGPELATGRIRHALAMTVPCTNGFTYPASKGALSCVRVPGVSKAKAPPTGARFQLDIPVKRIRRMKVPRWRKAILIALRRYGAYVTDTTGDARYWGFRFESQASYSAFGDPDPIVDLARRLGIKPVDVNRSGHDEYWFDYSGGVNWKRLRIVR